MVELAILEAIESADMLRAIPRLPKGTNTSHSANCQPQLSELLPHQWWIRCEGIVGVKRHCNQYATYIAIAIEISQQLWQVASVARSQKKNNAIESRWSSLHLFSLL